MPPVLIEGMWGFGDNIFQRSLIRRLITRREIYLDTPWPELYRDLGDVRFVKAFRKLRTQTKNSDRQPAGTYQAPPAGIARLRVSYGTGLSASNVLSCMEHSIGMPRDRELVFDLPRVPAPELPTDRPIAIVRPVTIRTEWRNEARNPLPGYVDTIARRLMETHFVVSVADLESGHEWLDGAPPACHLAAHAGEYSCGELLGLVQATSIIVGGVGWIVPAAIAAKVPAFIILGGHGSHNAPARVTDPRLDLSRLGFAYPENFCVCSDMRHRCNKTIRNVDSQFNEFVTRLGGPDAIAFQSASEEQVSLAS